MSDKVSKRAIEFGLKVATNAFRKRRGRSPTQEVEGLAAERHLSINQLTAYIAIGYEAGFRDASRAAVLDSRPSRA